MIIEMLVKQEVDIKTLYVKAKPLYWTSAKINGVEDTENGDNVPCKVGECWCPIIDIDTGQILNWKKGVTANIDYKISDNFNYNICDDNDEIIVSGEDTYVPDTFSITDSGYGDYFHIYVNENGIISNWEFTIDDFYNSIVV